MLILQKLEEEKSLSPNEKIVADYLLKNKDQIQSLSITTISKDTYTSPSTTVRLAQKCGYEGWKELRDAFYNEISYLESHFQIIDPNIPFEKNDSIQTISHKIETLLIDAIKDSAHLMHHDDLSKAVEYLNHSSTIYVFAITNNASVVYDFQYKMRYLFKKVEIILNPEDLHFVFPTIKKDDCAIFISYSGETFEIYKVIHKIKNLPCHTISMTSLGDNSLIPITDAHFYISTREKLYSKIGNYVTNESIHYILDVLYSCVFHKNYEKNLEMKFKFSKEIDSDRYSSVSIMQED